MSKLTALALPEGSIARATALAVLELGEQEIYVYPVHRTNTFFDDGFRFQYVLPHKDDEDLHARVREAAGRILWAIAKEEGCCLVLHIPHQDREIEVEYFRFTK